MTGLGILWRRVQQSTVAGYAFAVALPVAATFLVAWMGLPGFVFEHLVVLLVVAVAVPWGLGAAVVAAIVAVSADDLLLRPPMGQSTITGTRDVIDLVLFAAVAVVVSGLVTRARRERLLAQEAAERERRAREDRDRLIATISHDLATPLSVISGTLQFARRFGSKAELDLDRMLGRLETASARAASLVKTLADAQALDRDGFSLSLASVDVRDIVAPIVTMMDRLSERHPVVLAMTEEPVIVQGDADRLHRVIENLINNAIKYSPDGGAVEVSVGIEDTFGVVRVRDYGMGISPEALPRIFERSYRAPEAAAAAPGLGLGLNIAAHIAALHGGNMEARPAHPRGAMVTLRLPLPRDAQLRPAAAAQREIAT